MECFYISFVFYIYVNFTWIFTWNDLTHEITLKDSWQFHMNMIFTWTTGTCTCKSSFQVKIAYILYELQISLLFYHIHVWFQTNAFAEFFHGRIYHTNILHTDSFNFFGPSCLLTYTPGSSFCSVFVSIHKLYSQYFHNS